MSQVVLSAQKREDTGKAFARRSRREGHVPGIMYGAENEATPIIVNSMELNRLLRKQHAIITVNVDGEEKQAVIRELQYHPVSGNVLHIDFMRVSAGHAIKVTVPIHIVGEAKGAKSGGIFSSQKTELEIEVLPRFMPDNISIDISHLEIGDSIRVKDVPAENITFLDDEDDLICQVVMPRAETEEEEDLLDEEAEKEPEVITSRSDDEE
ncbi:MAG: 50S ribosomal protein L25 [Calditrichae bacterium]|nr:50S ribosomal protein L25 [Calditrichota bacterium]MCB9058789.1 50S ribosomal protein L25 [Calditrichia bacterium]